MGVKAERAYLCRFDTLDPNSTLPTLDRLAEEESCPHVRKAQPKVRGVELYAVMDSNCLNPPSSPHGRCIKGESSFLRLLAKKENINRSTKPQAVTCRLTSYRADLLRFPDGEIKDTTSVLDLKDKPLWVAPIYQKTTKCNCSDTSVRLEKIPDYELRHVPLQVDVSIWKSFPDGSFNSQQTTLSVTVPPHQKESEDASALHETPGQQSDFKKDQGRTIDSQLVPPVFQSRPVETPEIETKEKKTVVELDLVGYSTVCDNFEQGLDVDLVAQLNQQIQSFIDIGLNSVNATREGNVMATTGDGAILVFDLAQDAHNFAQAVHQATEQHNRTRHQGLAKRVFRSGAASGIIVMQRRSGGGYDIAGTTIARAVRLEAKAAPGGFLVDEATYESLSPQQKSQYGTKQLVAGKRDEEFEAYASQLNLDGPKDSSFFITDVKKPISQDRTGESGSDKRHRVLAHFKRLKSHQYVELIFLLEIPIGQRPSDALTLDQQKAQILRWSDENEKLDLLSEVLQELTTNKTDVAAS